jgi:hypothetical protein
MASDLVDRLRQAAWKNPHSDAGKRQSEAADRITAQADRIEALEAALRRLGSNEAFSYARAVDPKRDEELILRIDFARRVLEATDDRA